ncbi:PREDICTED: uncharacterized protein LOC105361687 [Ceratosolen solmsi marchali]|uniref:Uncharacterized protein LOC105361687 n=1 Tax=Ceratosolen solmsi marchali TaxID=326594 RepID=A0AAJ6YFS1_9HYME|nr:PREDICTED: uncharacterized protein LOC105361687 [Ceratosolen solmsi marchali]
MTVHECSPDVMGKWYFVKVIEHINEIKCGSFAEADTLSLSRMIIAAWPIIKLKSIETHGLPRIILLWEENAGILEYTFWVSRNEAPGVWNSDKIQNGSLANKPSYNQFIGTVHVMKAVASHMIITFCTCNVDDQKFSILLGRKYKLPKTDLLGMHKLLERRNLHLLSIRKSCSYGSTISNNGKASLILFGS